ncbi:MAG: hypothetical protein Q9167_002401 [Letrouitia subvulpina]
MASDDDFFVLRRFGKLGARVALLMQNRIVQLEEELLKEDEESRNRGDHSGSFRNDPREQRNKILEELLGRMERYRLSLRLIDIEVSLPSNQTGAYTSIERFILDHSDLKSRPEASKSQIRNVRQWLENNNRPIQEEEATFIERDGDLIPVVSKTKPPLRRLIDKMGYIGRWTCCRQAEGELNDTHYNSEANWYSETTIYSKEKRIDKFVTCTTILLGLAMLIGPLWLLQHLVIRRDAQARLIVITCFMVVFTVLLSIVTVAKPFEVLAATAAYGAVLMVFMQLGLPYG